MLQPAIINSLRNTSYLPYYPPLMHQTYILRSESDRFEGQHEVQQTTIIIIIIIIIINNNNNNNIIIIIIIIIRTTMREYLIGGLVLSVMFLVSPPNDPLGYLLPCNHPLVSPIPSLRQVARGSPLYLLTIRITCSWDQGE